MDLQYGKNTTSLYHRINSDNYRHIWVVGDLHGSYRILKAKLKEIGFDYEQDLLIATGDLIDRGMESAECLELINYDWFFSIQGNHEVMAYEALFVHQDANLWLANGGLWFFYIDPLEQQVTLQNLRKALKLPLVVEIDCNGKKYVIVHANYPGNEYVFGKPVDPDFILWDRTRVNAKRHRNIGGADLFIFGHSTPKDGVFRKANQLYVDTGIRFNQTVTLTQLK